MTAITTVGGGGSVWAFKKIFVAFTCQSFMEDWFRVIFLPILETETGKHFEVSSFVDTCQVPNIEN